jgi:transcriptional regulator GlxA family with amidase domain
VIEMVAFDGVQILDVAGPLQVFVTANESIAKAGGPQPYAVRTVARQASGVAASAGIALATQALSPPGDAVDTLIVAGGPGVEAATEDKELVAWITARAATARRTASVCTGACLLAATGILDGRRAVTHWSFCDDLARRFPAVQVEPDPIFVRDGSVWTSAGVTAGIDLALALVEADHGPFLARRVARHLVVFMQRPGGQAQFSVRLRTEPELRSSVRELIDQIVEDPAGDHRLAALSRRAGFSERHLSRVFAREIGTTPARYVEQIRIEAARAMLESTAASLEVIARRCGLSTAETLRRSFTREVGVTPHAYRQRFRTTGVGASAS